MDDLFGVQLPKIFVHGRMGVCVCARVCVFTFFLLSSKICFGLLTAAAAAAAAEKDDINTTQQTTLASKTIKKQILHMKIVR